MSEEALRMTPLSEIEQSRLRDFYDEALAMICDGREPVWQDISSAYRQTILMCAELHGKADCVGRTKASLGPDRLESLLKITVPSRIEPLLTALGVIVAGFVAGYGLGVPE